MSQYGAKLKLALLFALLVFPIFINIGFSGSIRFDADPFNNLGAPSLPLSVLFFCVLFVLSCFRLKLTRNIYVLVMILLLYLIGNIMVSGNIRPFIIFFGLVVPILNYFIVREYIIRSNAAVDAHEIFYLVVSCIVLSKFLIDLLFFGNAFSNYFITKDIVIYNYYDYFPFVYLLTLLMAYQMMLFRKYVLFSVIVCFVCYSCIFFSYSRLYQVLSVLLVPLFVSLKCVRLPVAFVFYTSLAIVIVLSIVVGILGGENLEESLSVRFAHWHHFLLTLNFYELIFPFLNSYRQEMNSGSFHNEFLEIFSYFGVSVFLYFYIVNEIFVKVQPKFSVISSVLAFSLMTGMLVQLNITNPYIGIIWSTFMATISCRPVHIFSYENNLVNKKCSMAIG